MPTWLVCCHASIPATLCRSARDNTSLNFRASGSRRCPSSRRHPLLEFGQRRSQTAVGGPPRWALAPLPLASSVPGRQRLLLLLLLQVQPLKSLGQPLIARARPRWGDCPSNTSSSLLETLLHAGGARAPATSRWRSTSSLNPWTRRHLLVRGVKMVTPRTDGGEHSTGTGWRRHNGCRFFAGGTCTTRFGGDAVAREVSTARP